MFSDLTKGQDLHHPSVSPEQLAAMVVQPLSQMGLAEDESLVELQQALLHMMEVCSQNKAMKMITNERLCTLAQQRIHRRRSSWCRTIWGISEKLQMNCISSVGLRNSELGIDHDDLIQEEHRLASSNLPV
ncbi:MAG: hypothetical protein ACLSEY_08060 [Enterocloster sp.]